MHAHAFTHTQKLSHTYKDFPVSQLCFHQSFSLALQSSVSMVMCCAAWKAVKKLPPWMRDHGNSTGLLSSVCSGLLIIPLCRVMASCTVLSVSSQQTIVFQPCILDANIKGSCLDTGEKEKNCCVKKWKHSRQAKIESLYVWGDVCIENRFAGWRLCVCSRVNSKACLGVTVRYMRVPRVKMGLFAKWELEKKKQQHKFTLAV